MANTPRARALMRELRAARDAQGLSVRQLGTRLGWSHAKVSRVENAKQGVTEADVSAMLAVLDVTGPDRDRLLKLTRELDEPAWWEVHQGVSDQLAGLIDAEQRALRITYVAPSLVPGLLQTRAYTRAVCEAAGMADHKIDDAIGVRQTRQGIVERAEPVEVVAFIDESVLLRPVGGAAVAAEQLRYMTKAGERPNVSLHVLPLGLGAHTGLDGMFAILDLPKEESAVHVETRHAGIMLSDAVDVRPFRSTVDRLGSMSLDAAASAELIATHVAHHERTAAHA